MGFRTLEISQAAELHIKNGQLEITSVEGVALIPIEDLDMIMAHGANIRLSTMDFLNDRAKMVHRSTKQGAVLCLCLIENCPLSYGFIHFSIRVRNSLGRAFIILFFTFPVKIQD